MFLSLPVYESTVNSSVVSPWVATPNPAKGIDFYLDLPEEMESGVAIAQGDGIYTIANIELDNVTSVSVGDRFFSLATSADNLRDGEFYFDFNTKTLIIKSDRPLQGTVLYSGTGGSSSLLSVRTTEICNLDHDLFLEKWNVTSVTVTRTFGGHPEAQIEFEICREKEAEVREELSGGTRVFTLETAWLCDGEPQITESDTSNLIAVSLQLVGVHSPGTPETRSPLDTPIKQRVIQGDNYSEPKEIDLGYLTERVGVNYLGEKIEVRIPKTAGKDDTFIPRSEIESRAIVAKGFPFYSNPNAVEVRKWGETRLHSISEDDLIEDTITFSRPGWGDKVDGIRMVEEWRDRELKLQFDRDRKSEGLKVTREFEGANNYSEVVSSAQLIRGLLRQPPVEFFAKPSSCFDNGGITKTAITRTTYNGSPLKIETETWGFVYDSLDIYEIQGENNNQIVLKDSVFPQSFWREIKTTTETYVYDAQGYLTQVLVTGQEIARPKQETEELEAVTLRARAQQAGLSTPEGAALLLQVANYQFTGLSIPVRDTTAHSLSLLSTYYEDIESSEEDDIPPKFCDRVDRSRADYTTIPGETTPEGITNPPIITGKWYTETERTVIVSTGATEKYAVRKSVVSQENEAGRDSFASASSVENLGRPPIHTRMDRVLNFGNLGNNVNWELYRGQKFYFNPTDERIPEATLSYPDVDDPDIALEIAKTQLSMENRSAETFSLNIYWRPDVFEGDRVVFRGNQYVVLKISDRRTLQKSGKWNGGLGLELGRLVRPNLTVTSN